MHLGYISLQCPYLLSSVPPACCQEDSQLLLCLSVPNQVLTINLLLLLRAWASHPAAVLRSIVTQSVRVSLSLQGLGLPFYVLRLLTALANCALLLMQLHIFELQFALHVQHFLLQSK